MGTVEHLKTLCCLGLKPESAMIAVTPVLHEILPHGWSRMVLLKPDATIGSSYSENPAAAAIFRERLWRWFIDDPSSPMSLWTPGFHAVSIGWMLHMQGRGWLESGWYREIEAPLDSCWLLDAMIGDAGRNFSFAHLILTRPRGGRRFTVDDMQRLDRLRPWLAHAFRPQASGDATSEDEELAGVAGAPVRSGQMILTSDANVVFQTAGRRIPSQNSRGRAGQLHTLCAGPRQAARAGSEASPVDYRRRERNFRHAASHAGFNRLWRFHARSQMARAGGHPSGRRRQGSEILPHSGDDRTARAPHCPCRPDLAGKRGHACPDRKSAFNLPLAN